VPRALSLDGLHPGQKDVFCSPARFKVLAAGRRWGKTRLGIAWAFAGAWCAKRVWWIAPNYPIGAIAWREMRARAPKLGAAILEAEKLLRFPGGGYIQLKSADNPPSLRGEGLDRVVLDEAAFMAEAAWDESLRPALTDRKGDALFGSTPNGHNWFYRLHATSDEGWQSWQHPTTDNPVIDPAEVALARANLPARVYLQEYEAQFIDQAGAVFRNVQRQATAAHQDGPVKGHQYVFGIDWARSNDFTAVIVFDISDNAAIGLDSWTGLAYNTQLDRVKALAERFQPVALVSETNNMGDVLSEQLLSSGLPIVPFTSTNATKSVLVDSLALALERQAVTFLPDPALISELESYQAVRLPSGLTRYTAPEGMNDDRAMALMLANWGAGNCVTDYSARLM